MWKCTFSVNFLFESHLISYCRMLADRKIMLYVFLITTLRRICKHMHRRVGPERCCHSTDHIWHWGTQRTGGRFGSVNKLETSEEGKQKSLQATLKTSLFFFDQNLPPQKTTSETLLLGVYKSQNWKGLKHSVTAFCAVVVSDKVCPQAHKVPDIHKFTGSERLHPNVLWDSAAANATAPTTTFERLQWQKKVQSEHFIITIFLGWPWFEPWVGLETSRYPFPTQIVLWKHFVLLVTKSCIFNDWEKR